MAKDRVYVSRQYKETKDKLVADKILGLDTAPNHVFFIFTLALGAECPVDALPSRDGLSLYNYFKTKDRAILASALLGTAQSDEEMEKYIDFDECTDYCERCAESGIVELQRLYADADADEELLERRLLAELDRLYTVMVESDIDDI